jgi:8-oxo-dGTP pyrophosphatase MutT (NUDIX family)
VARTQQVAALPWRQGEAGVEILLVTTRTTKRWVVPKGWTMDGKADHEAAAIEAFEEAGVKGEINANPVGHYGYVKVLQSGKARHLNVRVFALEVTESLEVWPERADRQRQWVSLQQAMAIAGEPELIPVILKFAEQRRDSATVAPRGVSVVERLKSWWRRLFL